MQIKEQDRNASPLAGRTAFITGVSRRAGIGAALAMKLGTLGANVFICGWPSHDADQTWGADNNGAQQILKSLREKRIEAEFVEADLQDPLAPQELIDQAHARFGHVDMLIANHARSDSQGLSEVTAAELDAQWAVNVRATLLLIKAFVAQHDGRRGGRIVLMTSGQHLGPMPGEIGYVATKGALHQLTKTLAAELQSSGITANTINPGPTDTGWASENQGADLLERSPQGRWGTPEDAARLIGWLVTDEAEWINGQVIDSDGGYNG